MFNYNQITYSIYMDNLTSLASNIISVVSMYLQLNTHLIMGNLLLCILGELFIGCYTLLYMFKYVGILFGPQLSLLEIISIRFVFEVSLDGI